MTRFFRIYKIILWAVLIMLAVPLMAAAIYNRPGLDDLNHLKSLKCMAEASSSTWDLVLRPVRMAVEWWNLYSGTFSALLLYGIVWSIFGTAWCSIYPFLIIIVCAFTCFQVVRCLRVFKPGIPKDVSTCASILLCIMFFLLLPDACNAFYWVASSSYVLWACVTLCLFSSIIRKCSLLPKSSMRDGLHVGLLCVAFFFLGGADSVNSTVAVALYAFVALWVFLKHRPKRYLIPYLFLFAGYLLATLAPGNMLRLSPYQRAATTLPIPLAAISAYFKAFQFIFSDFRFWIFLVLCFPMAKVAAASFSVSGKHVLLAAIASISLLAAGFFPLMLTVGTNYISLRHLNAYTLYLCVFLSLNLTLWISYATRRWQSSPRAETLPCRKAHGIRPLILSFAAALALLCVLSLPNISFLPFQLNTDVPVIKVLINWRAGALQTYATDYDAIVAKVRENPDKLTIVPSNPVSDIYYSPKLSSDPEMRQNIDFAEYYGAAGSRVKALTNTLD